MPLLSSTDYYYEAVQIANRNQGDSEDEYMDQSETSDDETY